MHDEEDYFERLYDDFVWQHGDFGWLILILKYGLLVADAAFFSYFVYNWLSLLIFDGWAGLMNWTFPWKIGSINMVGIILALSYPFLFMFVPAIIKGSHTELVARFRALVLGYLCIQTLWLIWLVRMCVCNAKLVPAVLVGLAIAALIWVCKKIIS